MPSRPGCIPLYAHSAISIFGDTNMATKSFYEDLVIDTPDAAARFAAVFEENRPYEIRGPVMKESDASLLRGLAEELGYKEI